MWPPRTSTVRSLCVWKARAWGVAWARTVFADGHLPDVLSVNAAAFLNNASVVETNKESESDFVCDDHVHLCVGWRRPQYHRYSTLRPIARWVDEDLAQFPRPVDAIVSELLVLTDCNLDFANYVLEIGGTPAGMRLVMASITVPSDQSVMDAARDWGGLRKSIGALHTHAPQRGRVPFLVPVPLRRVPVQTPVLLHWSPHGFVQEFEFKLRAPSDDLPEPLQVILAMRHTFGTQHASGNQSMVSPGSPPTLEVCRLAHHRAGGPRPSRLLPRLHGCAVPECWGPVPASPCRRLARVISPAHVSVDGSADAGHPAAGLPG